MKEITLAPFKSAKAACKIAEIGREKLRQGRKGGQGGPTAGNIEAGRFLNGRTHPLIAEEIPTMKLSHQPCQEDRERGETVFVLFRLEERRTVDSESVREAARQKVLEEGRMEAISKYLHSLYKKGVKTNVKLVESLEYKQTEPEIQKLLADERAVVEIEGERPITVGELTVRCWTSSTTGRRV
jgi:hypothetical protein